MPCSRCSTLAAILDTPEHYIVGKVYVTLAQAKYATELSNRLGCKSSELPDVVSALELRSEELQKISALFGHGLPFLSIRGKVEGLLNWQQLAREVA